MLATLAAALAACLVIAPPTGPGRAAPLAATVAPTPLPASQPEGAPESESPRRGGLFGFGVSLVPITFGTVQAISDGGTSVGVQYLLSLETELKGNLSLRTPLEIAVGAGDHGFAFLGTKPALLYRFRSSDEQKVVPFVGAGLVLGVVSADRTLLGLELLDESLDGGGGWDDDDLFDLRAGRSAPAAIHKDWDGGGGGGSINTEASFLAAPELNVGLELHLGRLFAFTFEVAYAWLPLEGRAIHQLQQRIGARFTF